MSSLKLPFRELQKLLFAHPDVKLSIAFKEYLGKDLADDLEPDEPYILYVGRNNITGAFLPATVKKSILEGDPEFESKVIARIKYKIGRGE